VIGVGLPRAAAQDERRPASDLEPQTDRTGLFREPKPIQKSVEIWERRVGSLGSESHDGFGVAFGGLLTGAGLVSAGPAYRHGLFGDQALFTSSVRASIRLYNAADAGLEFPKLFGERLMLGTAIEYQDALRVNYFGLGPGSSQDDRSGYRLRSADLGGYGALRFGRITIAGRLSRLSVIDVSGVAGPNVDYADTTELFDDMQAPLIAERPSFFHTDTSVTLDTRNASSLPTGGGVYSASWSHYGALGAERASFSRYELTASHFIPLATANWVLVLHGWTALTDTRDDNRVPFYLLPSLGGKNTLRSFSDFRFHDRQMAMTTIESRIAIFRHLDAVAFTDAGQVGPTLPSLRNDWKTSVGAGVRYHTDRQLVGRAEVAHGSEGWRLVFKATEPLTRSTPRGDRTTVIPFVP
jgi:hypothetical protein